MTATAICDGCVIIIIKRGGIQHDIQHGEGANQNGIYGLGGEWNTLNVFGVLSSFSWDSSESIQLIVCSKLHEITCHQLNNIPRNPKVYPNTPHHHLPIYSRLS